MRKRYVAPSRESEKKVLIDQLNQYGIYETVKGESLEKESYYTLLSKLAVKQAVAR